MRVWTYASPGSRKSIGTPAPPPNHHIAFSGILGLVFRMRSGDFCVRGSRWEEGGPEGSGSCCPVLQLASNLLQLGPTAIPSCKGAREMCLAKNSMKEGREEMLRAREQSLSHRDFPGKETLKPLPLFLEGRCFMTTHF